MGVKVCLVDDSSATLEVIATGLAMNGRFEVVGRYTSGSRFLRELPVLDVDVLCLDLSMPRLNGVEVLQRARTLRPNLPVLILTTFADASWVQPTLAVGASGYVLKTSAPDALALAIDTVLAGGFPTDEQVVRVLAAAPPVPAVPEIPHLSAREREVLNDLVAGLTNDEIGVERRLSLSAVKLVVSSLADKLGARNRTHLVSRAARLGITTFGANDAHP